MCVFCFIYVCVRLSANVDTVPLSVQFVYNAIQQNELCIIFCAYFDSFKLFIAVSIVYLSMCFMFSNLCLTSLVYQVSIIFHIIITLGELVILYKLRSTQVQTL